MTELAYVPSSEGGFCGFDSHRGHQRTREGVAERAYAVEVKPKRDVLCATSRRTVLTAETDGGGEHDRPMRCGFDSRPRPLRIWSGGVIWQPRKVQDLVPVRAWGFDSPLDHQFGGIRSFSRE